MKLSELITLLQERLETWGDMNVGIIYEFGLASPLEVNDLTVGEANDGELILVIDDISRKL
jgi:hypothetical protein